MATESEEIEMRINDIAQSPIGPSPTSAARSVAGSRPGNGVEGAHNGGDEVNLSDRARLLHKAKTALAAAHEARSAQFEAVQQQLADGTYRVPLDELAAKLLKFLR